MGTNQHPPSPIQSPSTTMDRIVFAEKPERVRKRKREAPPYEGPDLISSLPDDVLGAIVSLLRPEEAARTAVLSRRWRNVWRSTPLTVDERFSAFGFSVELISKILAAHPGPVRRLATGTFDFFPNMRLYDDWFRLPMFDALQDLALRFPLTDFHADLPAYALRFTSLRTLVLEHCSFPSALGCGSLAVPCLTHLLLHHVAITEELFHCIISNSPGIEALVLDTNSGYRRLRISLPRLRCLAIYCYRELPHPPPEQLEDLVVEDAAYLERLLLHETDIAPSVSKDNRCNKAEDDRLPCSWLPHSSAQQLNF